MPILRRLLYVQHSSLVIGFNRLTHWNGFDQSPNKQRYVISLRPLMCQGSFHGTINCQFFLQFACSFAEPKCIYAPLGTRLAYSVEKTLCPTDVLFHSNTEYPRNGNLVSLIWPHQHFNRSVRNNNLKAKRIEKCVSNHPFHYLSPLLAHTLCPFGFKGS